jgi:hypothetical protein
MAWRDKRVVVTGGAGFLGSFGEGEGCLQIESRYPS